jgi:hypothetical protein
MRRFPTGRQLFHPAVPERPHWTIEKTIGIRNGEFGINVTETLGGKRSQAEIF